MTTQCLDAFFEFLLFAEFHLSSNIGTGYGKGPGFTAATIGQGHRLTKQVRCDFDRIMLLHRAVAGVVVEILNALHTIDAVLRSKRPIEKRVIAVKQLDDGSIPRHQVTKEQSRLSLIEFLQAVSIVLLECLRADPAIDHTDGNVPGVRFFNPGGP